MADVHTKEQRSYNMSKIKGGDTTPEIILRKFLFSKGIRGYRVNANINGKPDLIFTKQKLAVFVDGCFWHKCPECFIKPKTNKKFWKEKLEGNVKRDKKVNYLLRKGGWKVLRLWEHEIKNNRDSCFRKISKELSNKEYGHDN